IEALRRLEGVRVQAVCDVNLELARQVARRYDIPVATDQAAAILEDRDIAVIHNCTPNRFHYPISRQALERGKHVLSEKPLSMSLAEAAELVALAERNGLVNGVNFCYRYYPVVQEMALRVRRGELGAVRMISGSYYQDWLSRHTDYSWRLERAESGESNITADLGSHWFDLIQFATGLRVTEVMGDFSRMIPRRLKPRKQALAFAQAAESATEEVDVELEDYSAVLFRMSNGAAGSFSTCQTCIGRKSDTEFQIYGSECSMAWNHKHSTELWIGHREKANEILIESPSLLDKSTARYASLPGGHPLGYHDAELNLFRDFYNAVKGDAATAPVSRPTFQTGLDEMKILAAIVESNKTRSWQHVRWQDKRSDQGATE
ncbi:MAG: Gfo/Idh/MocA family oxidoreductase, partial [bacterium]